ncbi:MAG TPA: hypothetical protein VGM03_19345 [Phycisphaerae bacterium]|jgi:hypothetical protein
MICRTLLGRGNRLLARSSAAAHVVTAFMKASGAWTTAGHAPLLRRKALAREGLVWLRERVELLDPTPEHFALASEWFFALYREDAQEERAGFDDYLDAALISSPPAHLLIRHVIIDHSHLERLCGKRALPVAPHYLHWRG